MASEENGSSSLEEVKRFIRNQEDLFELKLHERDKTIKKLNAQIEKIDEELAHLSLKFRPIPGVERGVQTLIEKSEENEVTNYLAIYSVYGTVHAVWQMLQDSLSQYPQFIEIIQNYEIGTLKRLAERGTIILDLRLTPLPTPKRLTTTHAFGEERDAQIGSIVKERRNQMLGYLEASSFMSEMTKFQDLNAFEKMSVNDIKRFFESQNQAFAKSLPPDEKARVTEKVYLLFEGIEGIDRKTIWPKLIGNKLRITPELYFSLQTMSLVNFPKSVERVIVEDLKRNLRSVYEDYTKQETSRGGKPCKIEEMPLLISIKEILMCFQVYRGDIGYVQGMSHLCMTLHKIFKNNIETFKNFCNLLFFKRPLIDFYRFDMEMLDQYTLLLGVNLQRNFRNQYEEFMLVQDNLTNMFVVENYFTIFSNYFVERDN